MGSMVKGLQGATKDPVVDTRFVACQLLPASPKSLLQFLHCYNSMEVAGLCQG